MLKKTDRGQRVRWKTPRPSPPAVLVVTLDKRSIRVGLNSGMNELSVVLSPAQAKLLCSQLQQLLATLGE